MGSIFEINDTLQINGEQGFPASLNRARHAQEPIQLSEVKDRIFEFVQKPGARVFQYDPVPVNFVENVGGKWLFWGRILIQGQRIEKKIAADGSWKEGDWVTGGTYKIVELWDPDYQKAHTLRFAPPGLSYF
jgi:hypothetical protein